MENVELIEKGIEEVKVSVLELQEAQEKIFNSLVEEFGFNKEGEDWLFDYVHNFAEIQTFSEYLQRYDVTLESLFNQIEA